MNEKTVHDLLQRAMAGEEPPLAVNRVVGGAVRAASKTRRRQLTAVIVVAAAVVPAVAFGGPAIARALAPAAPVRGGIALSPGATASAQASATPTATASPSPSVSRPAVPPAGSYSLIRPAAPPAAQSGAGSVPITSQSIGQLLIDDLPARAQTNQLMANADANAGDTSAVGQLAVAEFNDVTTAVGSGLVQVNLLDDPNGFFGQVCPASPGPGEQCTVYNLAGGVEVAEDVSTDKYGFQQLDVTVFRPGVANVSVSEANSAMAAHSPLNAHMPLTMAQAINIAMDPRWSFTISRSFVQQASGLRVAALPAS